MGKKDGKRAPPVQSETLEPGDGTTFPSEGQSLTVHYTGTLAADGSEFDSSRAKGVPFTFVLGAGKVIKGWELGLSSMSLGQRSRLAISAEAGYGKSGCEDRANASGSGHIPPHADLIFDVELLDIDDRRGVATEGRLQAYAKTLDAWIAGKMAKFDAEPEFATTKGGRLHLTLTLTLILSLSLSLTLSDFWVFSIAPMPHHRRAQTVRDQRGSQIRCARWLRRRTTPLSVMIRGCRSL